MNPKIVLAFTFREFPTQSIRGEKANRACVLPEVSDGAESLGRQGWLEFTEQTTEEKRTIQRENSKDLQRVSLKLNIDQCVNGGIYPPWRKDHPKRLQVIMPENSVLPFCFVENIKFQRSLGCVHRNLWPQ